MIKYVKCPRCDLNYIDEEKQEYCDVCIAEMRGSKLQFADLEDEDYAEIDAEIENEELCPICGVNRIRAGEPMCESCKQQQEYEEEEEVDIDKDEEWKNYIEEEDEDLTVDDEALKEIDEEFAEEEEEEDEYYHGEDDDPLNDFDDIGDYDEDYDDEDEDEEEDEDDDF